MISSSRRVFQPSALVAMALLLSAALALFLAPSGAGANHTNPGFENGSLTGWTIGESTEGVTVVGTDVINAGQSISQAPLEGSFMARLGNSAESSSVSQPIGQNEIHQDFVISENTVQFAYNAWTYDYTGYDDFSITVTRQPSGDVIYSHHQQAWGNSGDSSLKTSGWQVVNVPTSAHIGQNARVSFSAGGSSDTLYPFWAYIDSAEETPPSPTVELSAITINGIGVSHDPATGTIEIGRSPAAGAFEIRIPVVCPGGGDPNSVGLIVGTASSTLLTKDGGTIWVGSIPMPSGQGGETFPLTLIVDCAGTQLSILIGHLTLIDPSGFVTDSATTDPIAGASVTLQRFESGVWTDANPYATNEDSSPQIAPQVNPQVTDENGHYGWDVIAGTYRVVVSATGYVTQTSNSVDIPPPVTNLNIALVPGGIVILGDVDCSGTVTASDAMPLLDYIATGAPLPCDSSVAADIDCSGHIEPLDMLWILRYQAGVPQTQPGGCPNIGEPIEPL